MMVLVKRDKDRKAVVDQCGMWNRMVVSGEPAPRFGDGLLDQGLVARVCLVGRSNQSSNKTDL